MVEKLKVALIALGTGIAGILAAVGIELSFLSEEVLTGIAASVAAIIGYFIAKKN